MLKLNYDFLDYISMYSSRELVMTARHRILKDKIINGKSRLVAKKMKNEIVIKS